MKKFIIASVLLLASCAPPSVDAVRNLPVGPAPQNAQAQAIAFIKANLKDPYSMKVDHIEGARIGLCNYFGPWRGWYVPITYNAKNGFGGYVGSQTEFVWFRGGHAIAVVPSLMYCPQGNMF